MKEKKKKKKRRSRTGQKFFKKRWSKFLFVKFKEALLLLLLVLTRQLGSHGSDVVGGQQASLARALVASEHPPLVDRLHVQDQISFHQRNFICLCCRVAVQGLVTFLWSRDELNGGTRTERIGLYRVQTAAFAFSFPTERGLNIVMQDMLH